MIGKKLVKKGGGVVARLSSAHGCDSIVTSCVMRGDRQPHYVTDKYQVTNFSKDGSFERFLEKEQILKIQLIQRTMNPASSAKQSRDGK